MKCPNITNVPYFNLNLGKVEYRKEPHAIEGKGIVQCKECRAQWCCCECAVECNALDRKHFDKIYRRKQIPEHFDIICCNCSGNKPCWK